MLSVIAAAAAAAAAAPVKPHIVFFLADDFGHYDVGFHGNAEAHTPAIDALAKEGTVLDRHYVYRFCSPTRSAFLSGRLPLHVNVENRKTDTLGGVDLRMTTLSDHLRAAGYRCHISGKWHGGASLWGQLPTERGFESHLGYLNGMEDHFTQVYTKLNGVDLWDGDAPAYGRNGTYGGLQYAARALSVIDGHNASAPLFLYLPFQNTHQPLEVPARWLAPVAAAHPDWTSDKQHFMGMVWFLDEVVGNVTAALKEKGMWQRTVVVFSADNGGEQMYSGNNYPLRGGKYTDFEGGTRTAAFVSGGALPAAMRGVTSSALVHICDWYATFSAMAGIDATTDPKSPAGVPQPDSIDVWAAIASNGTSAGRAEVPLSTTALIGSGGRYKLVRSESAGGKNIWVGPEWPMGSSTKGFACDKRGCLFDLEADVEERHDLSANSSHADVFKQLSNRLDQIAASAWQTGDDGYSGEYTNCTTLDKYMAAHKGFIGPLCYPCLDPPCGAVTPAPSSETSALRDAAGTCASAGEGKKALVGVAKCTDLSAEWELDGGRVMRAGTDFCLRPVQPPRIPADCTEGTLVMSGVGACMELQSGRLVSPDCPGLCGAALVNGSLALANCSAAGASGWTLTNAPQ